MRYEGTVYRPPSEAQSLIIQLTIGCARNTCTFCNMYKAKQFRVRSLEEVIEDLHIAREYYRQYPVKRVFLADGDALVVKTDSLLYIMEQIHQIFPEVERITAYGAPADVLAKRPEELKRLRAAGLEMVYMGAESGDDIVLQNIKKGATAAEIIAAGQRLKAAGIKVSVTFISGLGSRMRLVEHAQETARVINAMNPDYVGFLTLMLEPGTKLYEQEQSGEFALLSPPEIIDELQILIENIDSEGTVFRSNHASNYVALKGTFNQDNDRMLREIAEIRENERYRSELLRGL